MILESLKDFHPASPDDQYVLSFRAGECFLFLDVLQTNRKWIRVASDRGLVGQVPKDLFVPHNDCRDISKIKAFIREARDLCVSRDDRLSYIFDHLLCEENDVLKLKCQIMINIYGQDSDDCEEMARPVNEKGDFRSVADQINELMLTVARGPSYCDLETVNELLTTHKSSLIREEVRLLPYARYLVQKHERRMKTENRELVLRSISVACQFDPSILDHIASEEFVVGLQHEIMAAPRTTSMFHTATELLSLVMGSLETTGLQAENVLTPELIKALVLHIEEVVHVSGETDFAMLPGHGILIIDLLISMNLSFVQGTNPLVEVIGGLWSPPTGFLQIIVGMFRNGLKYGKSPHEKSFDAVSKLVKDIVGGQDPGRYLNHALIALIFATIARGIQDFASGVQRLNLLLVLKTMCEQELLPETGLDGLRKGLLLISYDSHPFSGEEKLIVQQLMTNFKAQLLAWFVFRNDKNL